MKSYFISFKILSILPISVLSSVSSIYFGVLSTRSNLTESLMAITVHTTHCCVRPFTHANTHCSHVGARRAYLSKRRPAAKRPETTVQRPQVRLTVLPLSVTSSFIREFTLAILHCLSLSRARARAQPLDLHASSNLPLVPRMFFILRQSQPRNNLAKLLRKECASQKAVLIEIAFLTSASERQVRLNRQSFKFEVNKAKQRYLKKGRDEKMNFP